MSKKSRENAEIQARRRAFDKERRLTTYLVRDERLRGAPKMDAGFDLAEAVEARNAADNLVTEKVRNARNHGLSWTDIGFIIGLSRQGARQKYSDGDPASRASLR